MIVNFLKPEVLAKTPCLKNITNSYFKCSIHENTNAVPSLISYRFSAHPISAANNWLKRPPPLGLHHGRPQ